MNKIKVYEKTVYTFMTSQKILMMPTHGPTIHRRKIGVNDCDDDDYPDDIYMRSFIHVCMSEFLMQSEHTDQIR